eukprot:1187594-Prorocentrum_minimum.AAC.4
MVTPIVVGTPTYDCNRILHCFFSACRLVPSGTGQHMKGPNNEKACEKCKTNKRKVKATNERKSKSLFRMHNEENKRKERDQPVEKMTRKRRKNLDGVDVHTPASKRRSK